MGYVILSVRRFEKPQVKKVSERRDKSSKQIQVVEDARTKGTGLKQLIHNGVLVPDAYAPQGFTLTFRGTPLKLVRSKKRWR